MQSYQWQRKALGRSGFRVRAWSRGIQVEGVSGKEWERLAITEISTASNINRAADKQIYSYAVSISITLASNVKIIINYGAGRQSEDNIKIACVTSNP